jgi:hypothetical protein
MKNRFIIDLLCILLLGAGYYLLIYLAVTNDVPESIGVQPADGKTFSGEFNDWSLIVMGVTILSVLVWYILGEWGLRSTTMSSGGFLALWLCLLLLVIAGGVCAIFLGPQASDGAYILGIWYVGVAIIFYWLLTVLFSPVAVKTIPPLATVIRKW